MNRELRKAIYNKKMYYSKFLKDKSSKNWEQYRLRRNLVNKLKRKSENNYFQERCTTNVSLVDLNSKLFFTKFLSSIFCKLGWSFLLKV
jgi:alpha-galactosidase/6-phospho-beta-glucosidase family protein